ncbi:hypothetical protein ATN89_17580 [Comamonas thiooxydans]|nr:hypothetical protein ATN89_17580 [Comamonas thiooxydans]
MTTAAQALTTAAQALEALTQQNPQLLPGVCYDVTVTQDHEAQTLTIGFDVNRDYATGSITLQLIDPEETTIAWDSSIHTDNAECAPLMQQAQLALAMVQWFECNALPLLTSAGNEVV